MDSFWRDLRYGLRLLAKNSAVTAVAVLSLAIGIAANTTVFTLVNAFLLRPLPFRDPARLVHVWETNPKIGDDRSWVSLPDFLDWKQQSAANGEAEQRPKRAAAQQPIVHHDQPADADHGSPP